jgi:hypothetical protein
LVVTTSSHVRRIRSLPPHPISECVVMYEKRGVVSARDETLPLRLLVCVEQAERHAVELERRGRSHHLDGRDRITTEKEMTTLTLKLNRTLHGQLRRPLPPFEVLGRWIGRKIA